MRSFWTLGVVLSISLVGFSAQFSSRTEANTRLTHPVPLTQEEKLELFSLFKSHYKRNYNGPSEERFRMGVFHSNLETIHAHNQAKLSWTAGITNFTDLTNEEIQETILMDSQDCSATTPSNQLRKRREASLEAGDFPEPPFYVDWRNLGVVSEVKNQGKSCSMFQDLFQMVGFILKYKGCSPLVYSVFLELAPSSHRSSQSLDVFLFLVGLGD